jgi:hypothetical protein
MKVTHDLRHIKWLATEGWQGVARVLSVNFAQNLPLQGGM